jgi:predicted dinucleotide-binding enzyme
MKISIIGSGNIGGNLARLLVKAGHDVALVNSRGPASLKSFVDELGNKLHPTDIKGALDFSDIIVLSIHWRLIDSIPVFKVPGKIIVDTTNPYKDDGTIYDLGNEISSTKVINHFPGGAMVKAFNTIWFKHLAETGNKNLPPEERRVIPLAGDDKSAKEKIGKLIEEIGFGPLDTGTLREGSRFQGVNCILYNKELSVKAARKMIKDAKVSK